MGMTLLSQVSGSSLQDRLRGRQGVGLGNMRRIFDMWSNGTSPSVGVSVRTLAIPAKAESSAVPGVWEHAGGNPPIMFQPNERMRSSSEGAVPNPSPRA